MNKHHTKASTMTSLVPTAGAAPMVRCVGVSMLGLALLAAPAVAANCGNTKYFGNRFETSNQDCIR